jgi:hypothetical protein
MTGMTAASLFYEASDEAQKRKGVAFEFPCIEKTYDAKTSPYPPSLIRMGAFFTCPMMKRNMHKYLCTSLPSRRCSYSFSLDTQCHQIRKL